jgi:putative ABC transport system permease protein
MTPSASVSRETRSNNRLNHLFRDFRYALRNLHKDLRFSLLAILALALGIGASTVVFSVVYNVFLDPYPYANFNRSVVFEIRNTANSGGWKSRAFFSADEFRTFRSENHVFEDMISYDGFSRLFYDDGKSTRLLPHGASVSTNAFSFLGVAPFMGRTFIEEDGRLDAPAVFVMNYRLWQREFAGDTKILGKTFILRGEPRTLVGIMPPRFNAFDASLWIPRGPEDYGGHLMGRLKLGMTLEAVNSDLDAIAHHLQKANPKGIFPENFTVVSETLLDSAIGGFKKTLYALLASVLLLLLIACSNVANLLLTRATIRDREMAMRATLGASRGRLVSQLLVESFVLAAAAALAGTLLAYAALKVVVALIPAGALPAETTIRMNLPVLLLTLALTFLTSILCGLAPALHVLRGDIQPRLAGASRSVGGHTQHRKLRGALILAEVAFSIVLLVASGLLFRGFLSLTRVDLGFNPQNVLSFELVWPDSYNFNWSDPSSIVKARTRKNSVTSELLDRMKALPGVVSAAECIQEPPLHYDWSDLIIPGRPHSERWQTWHESVSEDYFQTLGVPLLRGRFFSKDDIAGARFIAVANAAFVRQYFPNEDPIGRRVKLEVLDRPFLDAPHNTYFEIVGIAGNYKTRDSENRSWQDFPELFIPYSVQGFSWRTFLVRTSIDPQIVLKSIRGELRAIDPGIAVGTPETIASSLGEFYRAPQFELMTLSTFAGIGLILIVIGVFSVMSYTVSLQIHEIGIRMALGAQQVDILRFALLNGFRWITFGIFAGLAASLALARLLASQISGVSPTDPATFSAVVAIVALVGLASCLIPARRASRVDPLVALHHE